METSSNITTLMDISPFKLDFIEPEPGKLYYGEGGNIGSLAVSSLDLERGLIFTGICYWGGNWQLKEEPYDTTETHGALFRPLELLMPAPQLKPVDEDKYLLNWLHQLSQSHIRRQIAELLNHEKQLMSDPSYYEYLEFLRESLNSLITRSNI